MQGTGKKIQNASYEGTDNKWYFETTLSMKNRLYKNSQIFLQYHHTINVFLYNM